MGAPAAISRVQPPSARVLVEGPSRGLYRCRRRTWHLRKMVRGDVRTGNA